MKDKAYSVLDAESGEPLDMVMSLPTPELVAKILKEMWRYCHAYHISNSVSYRHSPL